MTTAVCGPLTATVLPESNRIAIFRHGTSPEAVAMTTVCSFGGTDGTLETSLAPSGEYIATGHHNGSLRVWDIATGCQKWERMPSQREQVCAVAFSVDGRSLASGGSDGMIRIWNSTTGDAIGKPWQGDGVVVRSLCYAPDGEKLVSGGGDKTITLWSIAPGGIVGKCVKTFSGVHGKCVNRVVFSPIDGYTMASNDDGCVVLWDLEQGSHMISTSLEGDFKSASPSLALAFSPDGSTLASNAGSTILMWDVASRKRVRQLTGAHADNCRSISFSPDGCTLASGGWDKKINFWDVSSGRLRGQPVFPDEHVISLCFMPQEGQTLVSGGREGSIKLWDVASQRPRGGGHTGRILCLAFASNGVELASGAADCSVVFWDVASMRPKGKPLCGHNGPVSVVEFSADGRLLASGSDDRTILIWDVELKEPTLRQLKSTLPFTKTIGFTSTPTQRFVTALSFDPACPSRRLAAATVGGIVTMWDPTTGVELERLETGKDVDSLTFSDHRNCLNVRIADSGRVSSFPLLPCTATEVVADANNKPAVSTCASCGQLQEALRVAVAERAAAVAARAAAEERLLAASCSTTDDPFPVGQPYRLHGAPTEGRTSVEVTSVPSPVANLAKQFLRTRGSYLPGPAASPVAGYTVAQIELLAVDTGPFEARLKRLERLRAEGGDRFNPVKGDFDAEQLRVLMTLRESFEARSHKHGSNYPNLVFAFHGTRIEALGSVLSGLVAMRSTDAGYFGSGVYTTTSLEYATRYAFGEFDSDKAPQRTTRADGCAPVLLVCAGVGLAYPITPPRDYGKRPDRHCNLFGLPLQKGFDAHVAVVSQTAKFEAVCVGQMQYLELVIDQEAQVQALAVMWMRPP